MHRNAYQCIIARFYFFTLTHFSPNVKDNVSLFMYFQQNVIIENDPSQNNIN